MSDIDFVSANGGFEYTPLSLTDDDSLDLNLNENYEMDLNIDNKNGFWKYEEDVILKEIRDYLGGTYSAHYANDNKTQTLDLIDSIGDSEAFCRSNAIKYLSRFGKKEGKSKLDILKAIHYCILLYHFSGINKQPKGNYETF
jgi:hypothetical protein